MKEIKDIVAAFDRAQAAGLETALATVVQVDGSSYRRAGARMLITGDGQLTGAISGGCLEGDTLRKSLLVISQQRPMLVTYDTTDEDDAKFGVQLGCNGIIHILIEPIVAGQDNHPIALFRKMLEKRQKAVVVTLFSLQNRKGAQPGTCLLQLGGETFSRPVDDASLQSAILGDAALAFRTEASQETLYEVGGTSFKAFVEVLQPVISLVVAGAGNDIVPLARMADILGWDCTVVDGRAQYATRERFPTATRVLVAKPEAVLEQLQPDERTVFSLMTHNYNYDIALLELLLQQTTTPYIGLLGPRKKLQRMLDELAERGFIPDGEQLSRLYGPVGLDLGAEASEEIALSIISEIKAVMAGRNAQSLRTKSEPIHVRQAPETLPALIITS